MQCPRCRAELDPAVGVCPNCGAPARAHSGGEPSWRQQIRETVERRKELRKRQLAKRDEEGRQLSIFPESSEPPDGEDVDPVRKRRAEIRARIERKLATPRRISEVTEAGDVTIPVGSTAAAAATARELDAPLYQPSVPETMEDLPDEPGEFAVVTEVAPVSFDLATPWERVLAGLVDLGIVSVMLLTLLYLTSRVGGQPVRALPAPALTALSVIGTLLTVGYFLFFWGLSGQTLGKLLTGSRVVSARGGPLGLKGAILRGLGVAFSVLPLGAGFIGLWSDHERRGWHDRLSSSKVIRA